MPGRPNQGEQGPFVWMQEPQPVLEDTQETASMILEVLETPRLRFGHRYQLGDIVTVTLANGQQISDIVQHAEITWTAQGRTVKLQVGPTPDDDDASKWVKKVDRLSKRITQLENR